jgi:hypothetical protein
MCNRTSIFERQPENPAFTTAGEATSADQTGEPCPRYGLRRLTQFIAICVGAAVLAVVTPQVFAQINDVFEIDDGNAIDDKAAGFEPEDDWDSIIPPSGPPFPDADADALLSTFNDGNRGGTLFTKGSKDIDPISEWRFREGSVPPGNDFINTYAGAYNNAAGDLLLVCGGDRYQTQGSFAIGCWFFQDEVMASGGSFTGGHTDGDVLITAEFGGQGVDVVNVFQWQGDDATGSLVQQLDLGGQTNFQCSQNDLALIEACGETNLEPIDIPWEPGSTYKNQDGELVPAGTFIEVIINVTELFPEGSGCFTAFMATSRASAELNAELKEFALGDFNVCEVTFDKECNGGEYNTLTGTVDLEYVIYVKNTGAAPVGTAEVMDDRCTPDNLADDELVSFGPLGSGEESSQTKSCSLALPLPNTVPAAQNTIYDAFASTGPDGTGAIVDTVFGDLGPGDPCIENMDGTACSSAGGCPIDSNPSLMIEKDCVTRVVVDEGAVKVKVLFNGIFTNDSSSPPTPLQNVVVTDQTTGGTLLLVDQDGVAYLGGILEPGDSLFFGDMYFPDSVNSECPEEAAFMNTVTGSADNAINGEAVTPEDATATCRLCPAECEDLPPRP